MHLFNTLRGVWNALFHADEPPENVAQAVGWGRFPERLPDGRGGQTHLNHH